MMTNKEVEGTHYNRVFGADASIRFGQALSVNGYLAESFSPLAGKNEENLAYNAGFNYQDGTYTVDATYTGIQKNFTNEMGFVPRLGIHKFSSFIAYDWRPEALRKWVRSLRPHTMITHITDSQGKVETRDVGPHLGINFQNGSAIEVGSNSELENIRQPFVISNANGIWVPVGLYKYKSHFIRGNSDQSRRLSGSGRFEVGDFYGGYRHSYTVGASYRVNSKMNAAFNYTHNNISLPQPGAHFKTNLLLLRFNYSFSTTVFLKALVQYNSDLRQWSSNVRFNIIHRPLSDFFLVYNEQRDDLSGKLLDRTIIAKFTYMFAK